VGATTSTARSEGNSFCYRTSNTKTFSRLLGIDTVPVYILINKVANRGIFILTVPTELLGQDMKLAPGMVLLTINSYAMTSGTDVDNCLRDRWRKPFSYTYAINDHGKAKVLSGTVHQAQPVSPASSTLPSISESQGVRLMLQLINQSRAEDGLSPLSSDARLERLAGDYASYMAQNADKFDVRGKESPHTDLMGRSPEQRAHATGISNFLNENISRSAWPMDEKLVRQMHDQMMHSEGHRAAIMNKDARLVGIGIDHSSDRSFLTEEFGH
ncbi:MAG: CAP domain-containing protein, partial [Terriglobales bacterium]